MNLGRHFKYVATTPHAITEQVQAFCTELVPHGPAPVFLDITPDVFARPGRCYQNATNAADQLDGQVVFGWLIWELPGVYLTAEHHAVVDDDGRLIDVTPTFAGEERVLFLPDRLTDFKPPRPVNRYAALGRHPFIQRYVDLLRLNSELELHGRAFGFEYRRNDAEATRLLDAYFRQERERRIRKEKRKQKKQERRRKKHPR